MEIRTTQKLEQLRSELLDALKQSPRVSDKTDMFLKLSTQLSSMAQEGQKVATEHKILESLRFETMRDRYRLVQQATPRSFEWIYQHRDFSNWLEAKNGTYWISWKAGIWEVHSHGVFTRALLYQKGATARLTSILVMPSLEAAPCSHPRSFSTSCLLRSMIMRVLTTGGFRISMTHSTA